MSFSRYYYEQFREQIKKEGKLYEARSESKEIGRKKCKHRNTILKENTLKCLNCGAFWKGTGVAKLQKVL